MPRAATLTFALLLALATTASAVELVELKNGRIYEAKEVRIKGERLWVRLVPKQPGQEVSFTIPFERVLPEIVYHVWADSLDPKRADKHLELANWARKNGIFGLALKRYEIAAALDASYKEEVDTFKKVMREEKGDFLFKQAWELFQKGDLKAARVRADRLLAEFADTGGGTRAQELVRILDEREAHLSAKKKKAEDARALRRQETILKRLGYRIESADRLVRKVDSRRPVSAERRLYSAARSYRRGLETLADVEPFAVNEEVRKTVTAWLELLKDRAVRAYLRLADLRFLLQDEFGSMDAVHEVLTLEPGNEAALKVREKLLEGAKVERRRTDDYGGLFYVNRLRFRRYGYYGHGFFPHGGLGVLRGRRYSRFTVNGLGIYRLR